jgi:phospholipase C
MTIIVLLCGNLVRGAASEPKLKASDKIKHFIVLMMENRSFDHVLGWSAQYRANLAGLNGTEKNCAVPVSFEFPRHREPTCVTVNKNAPNVAVDDPLHDFQSQMLQIYGQEVPPANASGHAELMNGFVYSQAINGKDLENPMSMFTNVSAPVINYLAEQFTVFDRWHCQPLPTDPNRSFAMSGTANGMTDNFNGTLWSQQSYFDYLTERNVTWSAHYDVDMWAILYFQDMHQSPVNRARVHEMGKFFDDLKQGTLPQFVWLQPSMHTHPLHGPANWQHPDAPFSAGETLYKRVYEALRASKYWESSALLLTYDEHGGFYDSQQPPDMGVPPPDGVVAHNGFTFDRLGVRIPSILISPWTPAGTIVHAPPPDVAPTPTSQFESTSPLHTADRLFGFDDDEHITERVGWAAPFDYLFSLDAPRQDAPMKLPSVAADELDTQARIDAQFAKPLNDHMQVQLDFYCRLNGIAECPTLTNQGDASRFIAAQIDYFREHNDFPIRTRYAF